ncbi:MAG: hypothetical protein DSY82_03145 [Flavobacteriia bacterium]|nr:MAG: hypothetical protein DSY82_03145 [Flavobacteriia bacterium]
MYDEKTHSVKDRIVNIYQPYENILDNSIKIPLKNILLVEKITKPLVKRCYNTNILKQIPLLILLNRISREIIIS